VLLRAREPESSAALCLAEHVEDPAAPPSQLQGEVAAVRLDDLLAGTPAGRVTAMSLAPRTLLPAVLLLAAGGGLSIAGGSVASGGLLLLAALLVGIAAVWGRRRAR
jgi:hypothetical protein